jgi:hypothetical protein
MPDNAHRVLKALTEVAHVASVMVDGDVAKRIITKRAMRYIAHPDPEHRFLSGYYYDVDQAAFLRIKKTLLRLERLLDFSCSTSLWIRVEGLENFVTLAVQNGNVHRYYRFGQEKLELPAEMTECVRTGQTVAAPPEHPPQTLTVLAPAFDSLGDVVGIVELSTLDPTSQSPPPAWS